MADINADILRVGDNRVLNIAPGWRRVLVDISIPATQTYSTTDRIALFHSGGRSFGKQYGTNWIRQIRFLNGFQLTTIASGEAKGEWIANGQKLQLRRIGNNGTTLENDNEIPNGTSTSGSGTHARAYVYFL